MRASERKTVTFWIVALAVALTLSVNPAIAADKPNILFIMGDDIGWMQPSIYHRGLMVGETPDIDRIGQEGAMFMTYYAEQSCTAGRTAFFTGMHPLRAGMVMPQLPGATSYLLPGTPALAKFLHDLGYNTGEFGKNHLGDNTAALPTAHGFQEFWGYLYHLDAMQGVSFPDINKSPTEQTVVPPCENTPVPGLKPVPGAVDPRTATCMTPPRPVIWCKSSDGTEKNQTCKDEGPLTLERSKTMDEEISAKVIDFLDRNDPKKTNRPFFVWYNPARMHITTMLSEKYLDMLGEKGGKDWGINEAGMKQMDDNIGYVLKKLEDMGQLDNTIVVFTTDNGAEAITFPDGGVTPFRVGKLTTWEGGMRAPMVIRWPGHIKPGTVEDQMFSSLYWLATAKHPKTGRLCTDMVYQPMLELLAYLRANGFKTYIVSGGGIEFMRPWTERIYGIPPEQVIGSSIKTKFELRDGTSVLVRLPEINFIDDKAGKPVGINQHIGRRPIAAFGNSDGDIEMLQYTDSGKGAHLEMLVHHDDAEREYACTCDTKVGRLCKGLELARERGWLLISMKNDWKTIFAEK